MGAAAAGIFGGLLGGIGEGLVERRRRQDEMRTTAFQGALSALANIEKSPNFNPEWIPDITSATMQSIANYTGTGDKVAGKPGGKANKNASPLAPLQQLIGGIGQGIYSGQPQKSQAESGSAAAQTAKPSKGPLFQTTEERQEAQLRMERKAEEQREQIRLEYAEKAAKQKARLENQNNYELGAKVADSEGLVGDAWLKRVNEYIAGIKPSDQAKQFTPKPVKIVGPEGEFDGFETEQGLFKLGGTVPLDGSKYHTKEKEVKQPKPAAEFGGTVRDEVWARKHLNDPDPAVAGTAKDVLAAARKRATASAGGGESPYKMSDEELRALAERSLVTGQDPPFGLSAKNPLRERYQKMKADLILAQGGPGPSLETAASYKADTANLRELTRLQGGMKASLAGTNLEIDRLKKLAAAVPRSKFARFNQLDQFLKANLTDDPDLARFREALLAARYRYNSMVSNIRGGGAATNQVRTETADEIIGRFMPEGALDAAADEMKIGLQNIMTGLDQAVTDTKQRIRGGGASTSPANDPLGILK